MSSSQPFEQSSPTAGGDATKQSQFTYRQLAHLALSSVTCPLRVIAHIDLDAFYAQCEMVRLGVPEDKPLAVQQWQSLIAVNYPARKFGISRMITAKEARKLCPDAILQHVATWKEGDVKWAYHKDASANMATHKVSLDPYRLESRKILACMKECLPPDLQRVEKAGIDEVFLDLSAQVHTILLDRYPELSSPPKDLSEFLPLPPTTVLDWQADALVDLDASETEDDDPDWDDVAILLGSEIVRDVRAAVSEQLKYTCSGGIAHNKMLSKLGSAHRKPNQQTVIRNRAIQQFLSDFKFTKIRNLGGKLGTQIVDTFETDTVSGLLEVPVERLKQKLGDETGSWVYQTIRGIDQSEVNSRTQIKSMLSAKSFQPSINSREQASRWLRIFVGDIYARLVEEGVLENKRRPKTINLHFRHGGQTKSRQMPIPLGKTIDETILFDLASKLLGQIILEGNVWPCANLSLSVAGFEDGITGNMGIGGFLLKGDEAKAARENYYRSDNGASDRPEKRQKTEHGVRSIQGFFSKQPGTDESDKHWEGGDWPFDEEDNITATRRIHAPQSGLKNASITSYFCKQCNESFESNDSFQSHNDWHYAKDLQDEDRRLSRTPQPRPKPGPGENNNKGSKKDAGKSEKGQRKLSFG
ncbi:DNA-directed DNA polymerase eta [Pseudogymnoascus destructans]|uniref:DNA polymerase eta n=2 Tax=Pseudogymnoascus destructans TaxID=655981 RepID=L8FYW8_PSED2|nr:DNA-directed DNA polymerase eta [Pseudogymnoascus destructans]ELR04911.1 hypothetical protein GMDG_00170 [Pseudogymnoascus destructans 20631-21]OAF59930.2 DNA-directed DNA polymerase eta [Pseudogymnoascus destructans]